MSDEGRQVVAADVGDDARDVVDDDARDVGVDDAPAVTATDDHRHQAQPQPYVLDSTASPPYLYAHGDALALLGSGDARQALGGEPSSLGGEQHGGMLMLDSTPYGALSLGMDTSDSVGFSSNACASSTASASLPSASGTAALDVTTTATPGGGKAKKKSAASLSNISAITGKPKRYVRSTPACQRCYSDHKSCVGEEMPCERCQKRGFVCVPGVHPPRNPGSGAKRAAASATTISADGTPMQAAKRPRKMSAKRLRELELEQQQRQEQEQQQQHLQNSLLEAQQQAFGDMYAAAASATASPTGTRPLFYVPSPQQQQSMAAVFGAATSGADDDASRQAAAAAAVQMNQWMWPMMMPNTAASGAATGSSADDSPARSQWLAAVNEAGLLVGSPSMEMLSADNMLMAAAAAAAAAAVSGNASDVVETVAAAARVASGGMQLEDVLATGAPSASSSNNYDAENLDANAAAMNNHNDENSAIDAMAMGVLPPLKFPRMHYDGSEAA